MGAVTIAACLVGGWSVVMAFGMSLAFAAKRGDEAFERDIGAEADVSLTVAAVADQSRLTFQAAEVHHHLRCLDRLDQAAADHRAVIDSHQELGGLVRLHQAGGG
jgi:hypothetical protein